MSIKRNIASVSRSIRSASATSSGFTATGDLIFFIGESLSKFMGGVFSVVNGVAVTHPRFHFRDITINTRYQPRMKSRGIVYD